MRRSRHFANSRRAGSLAPALAAALLTVFLAAAFVLNVGWRRAGGREIVVAADAAALAAAAELACDERLLDGPLPRTALDRAAARADELASRHRIVGEPALPVSGEPRFGRRVTGEDGESRLLETDHAPSTAAVTVGRGRNGDLPWLFRAGGHTASRLTASAEASIGNRIISLKPRSGGTVPVWPLALRAEAETPTSVEDAATPTAGWRDQIESKLGADRFSYDRLAKRVVERPDGLPELTVVTLAPGGEVDEVGLAVVDAGQSFNAGRLDVAMREGLAADDLGVFGGEVPVASLAGSPVDAEALPRLPIEVERNLAAGDVRALFLFETLAGSGGRFTARLNGVVAARLMELRPTGDGGWRATFQPAVIATGTGVLADAGDGTAPENRYLYKVRLTR